MDELKDGGFTYYYTYYQAQQLLDNEIDVGRLAAAIPSYIFTGAEPQFPDGSKLRLAWDLIKHSLFASRRNKINGSLSEGHGMGERPSMKGNQNASKSKGEENTASKPQANRKQKPLNFKTVLINAGVTDEIASDFMDVRKGKKARNTQTALDAILSEIQTAKDNGISADEFIKSAVVNSWQAPKYEWYKNRQDSALTTQNDQRHADRRRTETKATSWQDYSETF